MFNVSRPHITGSSEGMKSGLVDLLAGRMCSVLTWITQTKRRAVTYGCKKNVVSSRAICRDVEGEPKTMFEGAQAT